MPRGRGILVGIRGGTRSARRGSIDGKGCASSVRSFAKSGITSFTRRLDKVAKGAKSDTVAVNVMGMVERVTVGARTRRRG